MTRILLHSDQPVLARGLHLVLSSTPDLKLLGTCPTVAELPQALAELRPDILLLDLTPQINFDVLSDLRDVLIGCKLALWVNDISTELAFQALGLGVRGIVRKTMSPEGLVACLGKIQSGGLWYEQSLTESFFSARRVILTQRESQLVSLLAQGLKNKEIARALFISEGTVKVYLSRLFHKVGVKDRFELALFGLKNLTTNGGLGPRGRMAPAHRLRSLVMTKLPGAEAATAVLHSRGGS